MSSRIRPVEAPQICLSSELIMEGFESTSEYAKWHDVPTFIGSFSIISNRAIWRTKTRAAAVFCSRYGGFDRSDDGIIQESL